MATIRERKISTNFNYNEVKEVPELGLPALVRIHSCGVPSVVSVTTSTSVRTERKISRAEPCFVTKQPSYSLEMAHFINAVRKNKLLRIDIEQFLRKLGIVDPGFTLSSASNLAPIRKDLHYTLDKLSFFAITCSKWSLESMIAEIERENSKWERMPARRRSNYIRTFYLDEAPFSTAEYEIVVLHPQHFLPNGAGFLVGSVQADGSFSNKVYVVAEDGALRVGKQSSDQRLPCFAGPKLRAPADILNPLLVAINAEMAFRRFKRTPHPLCQEYDELIDLTMELVKKIYFQPLVDVAWKEIEEIRSTRTIAVEAARDAEGVTRRDGKHSRTGRVVERPDPGGCPDKTIEYYQYLMSGQDRELTSDDEDLLADLGSQFDDSDADKDDLAPESVAGVAEKVYKWRVAV